MGKGSDIRLVVRPEIELCNLARNFWITYENITGHSFVKARHGDKSDAMSLLSDTVDIAACGPCGN